MYLRLDRGVQMNELDCIDFNEGAFKKLSPTLANQLQTFESSFAARSHTDSYIFRSFVRGIDFLS